MRAADGFGAIVSGLKVCNAKHDLVWYVTIPDICLRQRTNYCSPSSNLTEFDVRRLNISEAERQESLMDLEWEISCYCNMLYFMVQIFKGDDEFGDELSAFRREGVRFHPLTLVTQ